MKVKNIKCFLVWLFFGHRATDEGETVQMAQCKGCMNYVFKRK